jgi:hypothetical protein
MDPRRSCRRIGLAVIVGILLLTAACSDDGGGAPSQQVGCVEFAPASPAASGSVTSQIRPQSACDVAEIEFVATDIDDVFAVDLEIVYDDAVVRFVGFTTSGSILESDGAQITAVGSEVAPGRVELGLAREAATGIDVSGSQVLVTVFFASSFARGSGPMTPMNECLLGSEDPPVPKPGLNCNGGTFSIN